MKNLLSLLFLFGISFAAWSQTCTQRLNQAEDDYEAGRLLGIPDRISNCLQTGQFSAEEEIRARKLLVLVYIFTDQESRAEGALVQLLKADKEHRLDPQIDPAELFFLYNQFQTKPIFRIAGKVGANYSIQQVIGERSTTTIGDYPKFRNGKTIDGLSEYETGGETFQPNKGAGLNVWGEITAERHFGKGIEAGVGPQIRLSSYNVDQFIGNSGLSTNYTNQFMMLRAPLYVRYTLGYSNRDKKWLPYVMAGGSFDYMLSAGYSDASRSGGIAFTLGESDLKATGQVNNINYSVFGGVGAKLRMKTHFLTFEVRYDNSLANTINPENRYTNPDTLFDLGVVEDDLSLNFISFSVGYTYSIYKIKKLKDL